MNEPVHAIATFLTDGTIHPHYIQVNDVTYKLGDIVYIKDEIFAGIPTRLFCCCLEADGTTHEIKVRYHFRTHQWVLIGGSDNAIFKSST
jgi:hypothetical protein